MAIQVGSQILWDTDQRLSCLEILSPANVFINSFYNCNAIAFNGPEVRLSGLKTEFAFCESCTQQKTYFPWIFAFWPIIWRYKEYLLHRIAVKRKRFSVIPNTFRYYSYYIFNSRYCDKNDITLSKPQCLFSKRQISKAIMWTNITLHQDDQRETFSTHPHAVYSLSCLVCWTTAELFTFSSDE
jgi:hypothetical protein